MYSIDSSLPTNCSYVRVRVRLCHFKIQTHTLTLSHLCCVWLNLWKIVLFQRLQRGTEYSYSFCIQIRVNLRLWHRVFTTEIVFISFRVEIQSHTGTDFTYGTLYEYNLIPIKIRLLLLFQLCEYLINTIYKHSSALNAFNASALSLSCLRDST